MGGMGSLKIILAGQYPHGSAGGIGYNLGWCEFRER